MAEPPVESEITVLASKTVFIIRHARAEALVGAQRPRTVIEIDGDLDVGSATGFRAVVDDLVDDSRLAIDLTDCRTVDSTGLDALVTVGRTIRTAGGDFTTIGGSAEVLTALEAAGCATGRPHAGGLLGA